MYSIVKNKISNVLIGAYLNIVGYIPVRTLTSRETYDRRGFFV